MQDGVSRLMEWVSNVQLGAKHGGQELCSQRLNWQDQVLEVLPWRFRSEQLTFPFIHSWQFVLGRCVSLARILATLSDFQSSLESCRPWFVSGAGDPVAMWEHKQSEEPPGNFFGSGYILSMPTCFTGKGYLGFSVL